MHESHGGHGEVLPEETTPQGTQADAVPFGHEARDMNLRQVIGWFVGTAVSTIIIQIIFFFGWLQWNAIAQTRQPLPSPLFAVPQVPPAPRLEPNPADAATYPEHPMRLGPDFLHDFRVQ